MQSEAGVRRGRISRTAAATHEPSSVRQRVYAVLEEGQLEGLTSGIVEVLLIILILANVIAVTLETVPSIYGKYHGFFSGFERFTVGAYTIEYFVRLWSAMEDPRIAARGPVRGRVAFALRPFMVIDLLAFGPSYLNFIFGGVIDLRVLRVFRLLRLLKIARYSQAMPALLGVLYAERRALFGAFVLLLCVTCVSGEMMHLVEGPTQPKVFGTLPNAAYWAITTLTTVGYGDTTPVTALGKLVAGITMVLGLTLFALPVGILATGFVNDLHRREFTITWSMLKRQPLFAGFEVDAIADFLDPMGAAIMRDHTRITVAGQSANVFYLVVSGRARAEDETGTWNIEAGDAIGAEALHDSSFYTATVTARSEMRMMSLSSEDLRRLARKHPILRRRLDNEEPW
jgi:voltage-gated potassium channel